MEIDILAENRHTKEKAYIECKFTKHNFEAQVINKLIGNVAQNDDINLAYLVTTSEPGSDAKGLLVDIDKKNNLIRNIIRFAHIGPDELISLFLEINHLPGLEARLSAIDPQIIKEISAATFVITPNEKCWVLEKQKGGIPDIAIVIRQIMDQTL